MPGLILGCLVGCSTARPDLSGLINEGNEVRIYEVFGMDCPGCHGGLENLVNKIPGVKISKANWQKQRLQVVLIPNAEVDDKAVYEAIRRANFTPGERLN
jgi:cation transport ATPase